MNFGIGAYIKNVGNNYSVENLKFAEKICLFCNCDLYGYHIYKKFTRNNDDVSNWNIESKLKSSGDTISALEGKDDLERRIILKNAITTRVSTQSEIVWFLNKRISISRNNRNYIFLIPKYERDLEYVISEQFTEMCLRYSG